MAERTPAKNPKDVERESTSSYQNEPSNALHTGDLTGNNNTVKIEPHDATQGTEESLRMATSEQNDEQSSQNNGRQQSEMAMKPVHEARQENTPSASTSNVKRKYVHLDALDCSDLAQTEAGALALKNPLLVRTSSKDSNRGLYPRSPKTTHMASDVYSRLSTKTQIRTPSKVKLSKEQMKNQRKMEEFFLVSPNKRSKSEVSPNRSSQECSTPPTGGKIMATFPRSTTLPFPKKSLNSQFATMGAPHSSPSQAGVSSNTVPQSGSQQSALVKAQNSDKSLKSVSSDHHQASTSAKKNPDPSQSPGPSGSVKSVDADIENFLNDDSWDAFDLDVDISTPQHKVKILHSFSPKSQKSTPTKIFPRQSQSPSPSKSVKSTVESDIEDFLNDDSWNACQPEIENDLASPLKVKSDCRCSQKNTPTKWFLKPNQSPGPSPSKSVKSTVESDIEDFHNDDSWDGIQEEMEVSLPNDVKSVKNKTNPDSNSTKVDVKNSVDNIEAFKTDSSFDNIDPRILVSDIHPDCSSSQPDTFGLLGEGSSSYSDEDVPGFDQLPVEVLERIFCFVPMSAGLNLSLVCKAWNGIISKKDFMPWKKTYHRMRMNSLDEVAEELTAITHDQEETEESCLLLLVRNMPKFKARFGSTMDKDLKRHPKYDLARDVMKTRAPELLLSEIPNPWSTVCLLIILSETVQDVLRILDCLLHATASCTTMEVLECLYCIAAYMWKYKLRFGLNGGCHYRVYHALYLFENSHASVPVENSGQSAMPRRGSALQKYRMDPTHEQSQIINYDIAPGKVVKVVAFAGTGKTMTLVKYAERRPNMSFLYVVFNKSVLQRAKDIFPDNVTSKTTHSLAYAAVGWKYKSKLDSSLNPFYLHKLLPPGERKELPWLRYASLVCKTLERFCANDMDYITTRHVPQDYCTHTVNGDQIVAERHVLEHPLRMKISSDAESVWKKMIDPKNKDARIFHDVYLKLYQLNKHELSQYDCLLIDEAQDLTPAQQDIFMNQRGAKILVGDPRQQIYKFRGANDAMNRVTSEKTFHLTQSFRFGTEIAYVANCLLEQGTSGNNNQMRRLLIGKREPGRIDGETVGQKAIITRTNVSLFTEAVKIVEGNSKTTLAFVGGVDRYGFDVILDIYQLMQPAHRREQIKNPKIWVHKNYGALKVYANETDNLELVNKIRIVDMYHVRVPELIKKICERTRQESMADIILSTAHKSKGLEFDTVKITDDFGICESKLDIFRVLEKDELNLVYVAVTRAKKSLILTHSLMKFIGNHPTLEKFAYPAAPRLSNDQNVVCAECKEAIPSGYVVLLSKKALQLTYPEVQREGGILCPQCSFKVYPSFNCFFPTEDLDESQNSP